MAMNHKIAMHFAARDAEALERAQRRQENPVAVAISKFNADFNEAKRDITEKLGGVFEVLPSEMQSFFDELLGQCQDMQKLISSSSSFLSAFDVRQALKDAHDLQCTVTNKQEAMLPRKRFAFKNRMRKQRSSIDNNAPSLGGGSSSGASSSSKFSMGSDERAHPQAAQQDMACSRSDLTDETLALGPEEITGLDVSLSRLRKCFVRLHGSPSTLHMDNLDSCTILCGPVSTSVFLDQCTNCVLVIGCQQMRMHQSLKCDIYLHVTSRAIIEDCQEIRVAPYNYLYEQYTEHLLKSGLSRTANHWRSVNDFNWLSASQPSPNWCVIPDGERVINWRQAPIGIPAEPGSHDEETPSVAMNVVA